jgi:leucyl aminopeptidase
MDVEVKESADDRIHRHSKVVDSVILSHEQDIQTNKMLYMMAVRESLNFTRQLSNMRATVCNPDYMETVIRAVADGLDVHVIKGPELQKQGLNCHYEVGKGATAPPRYISVSYYGNPTSGEVDLALVGKCLTYDTGGLNIKKSTMEEMHLDKTGACAVLGTLHATMTLKPKKNVVFVFGIAENAIGASVYKPGDIIKSLKGLTVEVGNTDAEGRLVLADCITYTCRKFNPRRMIDIASLTGSIMVALGESTGGLFSNNDLFAKSLEEAGKEHGEPLWRMPIMEEHRETIKRDAADLNNCGKIRYADASNAAAFLERFLEKREDGTDVEWAHLDIAGVCISKEMGCTGFGLQTMLDAVHK